MPFPRINSKDVLLSNDASPATIGFFFFFAHSVVMAGATVEIFELRYICEGVSVVIVCVCDN